MKPTKAATAPRRKNAARKKPGAKAVRIQMDAKTKTLFKGKNSVWNFYVTRVFSGIARAMR